MQLRRIRLICYIHQVASTPDKATKIAMLHSISQNFNDE